LGTSESAAYFLLWSYVKKGYVIKLKRGLYALKSNFPSPYLVSNRLYQPSYISFDTALSFHHLIPETIYAITCATTNITREFVAKGIVYTYHRIKKSAFTGYEPIKYMGRVIFMAKPEKALADYLYFVDLKQRSLQYERLDLKDINKQKLLEYIKLFKRPKMYRLVDEIYAEFKRPKKIY
jgi:predicted transcriptional regulator of viral defense system